MGIREHDPLPGGRKAISNEHAALGSVLREARQRAGASTRSFGYSSGHISNVEGGHATPSRDLAEMYVRVFGAQRSVVEGLLDRIEHGARAKKDARLRSQRSSAGKPSLEQPAQLTAITRGIDVRDHYLVERYDVEFDVDAAGAIRSVSSAVAIRAISPNVSFYYSGHAPDDAQRARTPEVTALAGCTLERVNLSPLGAAEVFFRLDRVLSPDELEPYELSYRVVFPGARRADPAIYYVTRPGVQTHTMTVRFTPPALPEQIWWVAASDMYIAEQPDPGHELPTSASGSYTRTFGHLAPGWCYGLTWTWPDAVR